MKLPSSHESEAALLGCILFKPECIRKLEGLEVEDFNHPRHQVIFTAIRNLEAKLSVIDEVTITAELGRIGKLEAVGGFGAIVELALRGGSGDGVEDYAAIMVRHRVTRDTIQTLSALQAKLTSDHGGLDELEGEGAVQTCRRALAEVQTRSVMSSMSIGDVVKGRVREMQALEDRRARGESVLTGVPTGIAKLDEKLGGYQFEIVTLIAGRPRMGKSSVMMTAARAATDAGLGVHVFSLEDARSSYADRAIANVANVGVSTMRQASMQRAEYEQFTRGANNLVKRKQWRYDDRRGRTAPQIIEAWRREGEQNNTKLVIVDYIQRVRATNPKAPKHERIGDATRDFADAAAADGIALLLGAQINRGATQRAGGRPTLEDIKDSGELEELPKCAVLIHRGSVYGPPVEGVDYDPKWEAPMNRRPDDEEWMQRIELIVAKNSNGEEGDVWATWTGHRTLAS